MGRPESAQQDDPRTCPHFGWAIQRDQLIRRPSATLPGPPGAGAAGRSEDLFRSGRTIHRDRRIRRPPGYAAWPTRSRRTRAIRGLVPLRVGYSARPNHPSAIRYAAWLTRNRRSRAIRGLVPLRVGYSARPNSSVRHPLRCLAHPEAGAAGRSEDLFRSGRTIHRDRRIRRPPGYAAWPTRSRRTRAIRGFFPLSASHSAGRSSVLRAHLLNGPSGRASISSFVPTLGGPVSA